MNTVLIRGKGVSLAVAVTHLFNQCLGHLRVLPGTPVCSEKVEALRLTDSLSTKRKTDADKSEPARHAHEQVERIGRTGVQACHIQI